ncbi:hypothetical protein [Lysobacter gummosus]|uniref:hypothetical protein n=1 Tax=Lysobacter gummosus TaxID=262324 RepID=UPI00362BADB3
MSGEPTTPRAGAAPGSEPTRQPQSSGFAVRTAHAPRAGHRGRLRGGPGRWRRPCDRRPGSG